MPPHRDYFSELGLSRIINVSGSETLYGAAPICDEVIEAVAALGPSCVDMRELQRAAGRMIADAFGSEAGMVAHCSAAGISIAIAGCMTGEDPRLIHRLPDTTGMKDEVILQCGHSIDYGAPLRQNIRLTGAKIREIGTDVTCSGAELEAAINAQTVAAVFVVSHHTVQTGMIELAVYRRICHERNVPVIVDAAAEPDPRPFLANGADLVIASVHKRFAGLTAAVVAGKSGLVHACLAQEKGIGRPMKISKEAIIGTIAALARWRRLDAREMLRSVDSRLARAQARLGGIPGLAATIVRDSISQQFSRLHIELDPALSGFTASELAARLRSGCPSIIVRESHNSLVQLDFRLITDESADAVVNAIVEVIGRNREIC